MKIIQSGNKKILRISISELQDICDSNQPYLTRFSAKNWKKTNLLKTENKNALDLAEKIKKELSKRGHDVSKIKQSFSNSVCIPIVDGYRIGIEIKPWASQNNKHLKWKSGTIVIVGSGVDKFFKRKRVKKSVDHICNYVEKIIDFYNKKENQRLKRQEVSEKKREEKVEQMKVLRLVEKR